MKPELILQQVIDVPSCALGEGLHYIPQKQLLYWVDILKHRLFKLHLPTDKLEIHTFDEAVCWVNSTNTGQLIIGCKSGIYEYQIETQSKDLLWQNRQAANNIRLNDAKTDRKGRLFFGTMDDLEHSALGNLYQLTADRITKKVDENYTVSNGPACSVDGSRLYSVSSSKQIIYSFDIYPSGQLKNKHALINFPKEYGYPDGITVDCNDNIWVACWGGGAVLCFSSNGQLITAVDVPAPYVTNILFAGDNYQEVYVTTATNPMSELEKKAFPDSGKVFKFLSNLSGIAEEPINLK